MEENPGPYECGMCQKRASGCSIKCTWIHQVYSEMTRGQIRQIAGKERYAFECRKCREPSKTTGTIVPGTPDETVPPSSEFSVRAERSHRVRKVKQRHPTEDHKETHRRQKKTIQENRRAERTKHKPQKTRRIVTWNLQGISIEIKIAAALEEQ